MKAILFLFSLLTTTVVGQGFLQLDVGRRAANLGVNNRVTRRQNGITPVEAPVYQNTNMLEYIINITVGEPGQTMGVTLDTGSSDLWVPTPELCKTVQCDLGSFDPTASSGYTVLLQDQFNITYAGPGDSDAGDWGRDSVVVGGSSTTISKQIFGVATRGVDQHGVLGVGYDLNEATPNPGQNGLYDNVIDNMVSQGIVARKAYSIYLNSLNETTGSIIFGGIDTTKYVEPLVALPLQPGPSGSTVPEFYVTLTSVVFNDAAGSSTKLTQAGYSQSVLLDTGTTGTLFDATTFDALALGLGAVDSGDLNFLVPCKYSNTNASLSYTFGGENGVTIVVPVSELINGQYGNQCSLEIGPPIGGVSIFGDSFLRSAYIVLDMDNNVAAIAQAVGDQASTSSVVAIPSGSTIPGATITAMATGTQLQGAAASATGSVPVVNPRHKTSYPIGTPTFSLGAAATSGVHNGNPRATEVPRAILLGAGLLAGVLLA